MNKWMWVTIAVFAPNLLGLIIYLVVRSSYSKKCLTCGRKLGQDYLVCPYCGTDLNKHCSGCGKEVSPDWKVCPYCKYELKK
jgi:predicted amidophosphoribosyltransferase